MLSTWELLASRDETNTSKNVLSRDEINLKSIPFYIAYKIFTIYNFLEQCRIVEFFSSNDIVIGIKNIYNVSFVSWNKEIFQN